MKKMHFMRDLKNLAIIFTLLLIVASCKKENDTPDSQAVLKSDMQLIIDSLYQQSGISTGIIVSIQKPSDNFNFQYAAGYSDIEGTIPITPQDIVCIASNTKTFVAALILILKEENKLSLDDKLTAYFDTSFVDSLCVFENQSYGRDITLKMLLNHTSGIPDFESIEFINSFLESPYKFRPPLQSIRYAISNEPATNIPGTAFHYSNTNYILLGLIAEMIEGESLHDLLRTHIYIPSGISNAYINGYEVGTGTLAHGYWLDSLDVCGYNMSWEWACGGIMCRVEEMNLFLVSLLQGKLYKNASTLAEMTNFENGNYALGIVRSNHNNFDFIGHTGGALGYTSVMYYEKNLDAYFSIACNSNGESDLFVQVLDGLSEKVKAYTRN